MTQFSIPHEGRVTGDAGPYTDDQWANLWKYAWQAKDANDGIIAGSGDGTNPPLWIRANSPAAKNVLIAPGRAFVNGRFYENDASITQAISDNTSGSDRIDRIVLRFDASAQTVRIAVKEGIPAATPSAPALTQTTSTYEIPLVQVYVANGFSSITNAGITAEYNKVPDYRGIEKQPSKVALSGNIYNVMRGIIEVDGEQVVIGDNRLSHNNVWWLNGAVGTTPANGYVHLYVSPRGLVRFHDELPYLPRPSIGAIKAIMRVNQVGWDGSTGNGFNATSIVYDNDTGEADVTSFGDLVAVLDDSETLSDPEFSLWKSKNGGAADTTGGINQWSWLMLSSIDTATNTITVRSNHGVSIADNDILVVIEPGELLYRYENGVYWKWIGSSYLDAGGNFTQYTNRHVQHEVDADFSTNSASFVEIPIAPRTKYICNYGQYAMGFIQTHIEADNVVTASPYVQLEIRRDTLQLSEVAQATREFNHTGEVTPFRIGGLLQPISSPPGIFGMSPFWHSTGGITIRRRQALEPLLMQVQVHDR